MYRRIAHHAALANLLLTCFKLRLDQGDNPGIRRYQALNSRQYQAQRDKRYINRGALCEGRGGD
jgi:hypothetical protein